MWIVAFYHRMRRGKSKVIRKADCVANLSQHGAEFGAPKLDITS